MIRVVFDTNVYLSAIFWSGNPENCIALAKLKKVEAFSSQPIIDEIKTKLIEKFGVSEKESGIIIDDIISFTELIKPKSHFKIDIDDPDDLKFIDCAIDSRSRLIVSGDKHLLNLKKVSNIRIVNPFDFLSLCRFLISKT